MRDLQDKQTGDIVSTMTFQYFVGQPTSRCEKQHYCAYIDQHQVSTGRTARSGNSATRGMGTGWKIGREKHTLIPKRLADDLVTGGLRDGHVFGVTVLLDLAVAVLDIATVLIESCHLHCFFNSKDVNS